MSAAQRRQHPIVRGACEACHSRKVRCELPPEGGPCVSCTAASRQCFFLPRVRSGRPRAGDDTGAGAGVGAGAGAGAGASGGGNSHTARTPLPPPPQPPPPPAPRPSLTVETPTSTSTGTGAGTGSSQGRQSFDSSGMSTPNSRTTGSSSAIFGSTSKAFDQNWQDTRTLNFAQLDPDSPPTVTSAAPTTSLPPMMSMADSGADAMALDPDFFCQDPIDMDRFTHNQCDPTTTTTAAAAALTPMSPSTFSRLFTAQCDDTLHSLVASDHGQRSMDGGQGGYTTGPLIMPGSGAASGAGHSTCTESGDASDGVTCSVTSPVAAADEASLTKALDVAAKLHGYVASLSLCLERHKQGLVKPDITMNNRGLQLLLQAVDCTCTSISAIFGPLASSRSNSRTDLMHYSTAFPTGQSITPPPTRPMTPNRGRGGGGGLTESGLVFLAAIFKIFHAFELLCEYHVTPETHHSADVLLLYKRCEFNLMQTKVALTQIARLVPGLVDMTRQATARANDLELQFANAAREHSRFWT